MNARGTIASIPLDCWRRITITLRYDDVQSLWMTGSHAMRDILGVGGAVHDTIVMLNQPLTAGVFHYRWPLSVSRYKRLEHLELHQTGAYVTRGVDWVPSAMIPLCQHFPPTLTSLCLYHMQTPLKYILLEPMPLSTSACSMHHARLLVQCRDFMQTRLAHASCGDMAVNFLRAFVDYVRACSPWIDALPHLHRFEYTCNNVDSVDTIDLILLAILPASLRMLKLPTYKIEVVYSQHVPTFREIFPCVHDLQYVTLVVAQQDSLIMMEYIIERCVFSQPLRDLLASCTNLDLHTITSNADEMLWNMDELNHYQSSLVFRTIIDGTPCDPCLEDDNHNLILYTRTDGDHRASIRARTDVNGESRSLTPVDGGDLRLDADVESEHRHVIQIHDNARECDVNLAELDSNASNTTFSFQHDRLHARNTVSSTAIQGTVSCSDIVWLNTWPFYNVDCVTRDIRAAIRHLNLELESILHDQQRDATNVSVYHSIRVQRALHLMMQVAQIDANCHLSMANIAMGEKSLFFVRCARLVEACASRQRRAFLDDARMDEYVFDFCDNLVRGTQMLVFQNSPSTEPPMHDEDDPWCSVHWSFGYMIAQRFLTVQPIIIHHEPLQYGALLYRHECQRICSMTRHNSWHEITIALIRASVSITWSPTTLSNVLPVCAHLDEDEDDANKRKLSTSVLPAASSPPSSPPFTDDVDDDALLFYNLGDATRIIELSFDDDDGCIHFTDIFVPEMTRLRLRIEFTTKIRINTRLTDAFVDAMRGLPRLDDLSLILSAYYSVKNINKYVASCLSELQSSLRTLELYLACEFPRGVTVWPIGLTSLTLSECPRVYPTPLRKFHHNEMTLAHIQALPPTLTHFSTMHIRFSTLHALPAALTSLTLDTYPVRSQHKLQCLQNLPPNLRTLSLCIHHSASLWDHTEAWPISITALKLNMFAEQNVRDETLPRLLDFKLYMDYDRVFPPYLRELKFVVHHDERTRITLDSNFVKCLPSTLTQLSMPPHRIFLSSYACSLLERQMPQLRQLQINVNLCHMDVAAPAIPYGDFVRQCTTTFVHDAYRYQYDILRIKTGQSPRSMIHVQNRNQYKYAHTTIQQHMAHIFATLPRSLERLSITLSTPIEPFEQFMFLPLDIRHYAALPPNLVYFDTDHHRARDFASDEVQSHLPYLCTI